MIRLEMKNYNTILTEKPQKNQLYHQIKLRNINILQWQNKQFYIYSLRKSFQKTKKVIEYYGEKQTKGPKEHGK